MSASNNVECVRHSSSERSLTSPLFEQRRTSAPTISCAPRKSCRERPGSRQRRSRATGPRRRVSSSPPGSSPRSRWRLRQATAPTCLRPRIGLPYPPAGPCCTRGRLFIVASHPVSVRSPARPCLAPAPADRAAGPARHRGIRRAVRGGVARPECRARGLARAVECARRCRRGRRHGNVRARARARPVLRGRPRAPGATRTVRPPGVVAPARQWARRARAAARAGRDAGAAAHGRRDDPRPARGARGCDHRLHGNLARAGMACPAAADWRHGRRRGLAAQTPGAGRTVKYGHRHAPVRRGARRRGTQRAARCGPARRWRGRTPRPCSCWRRGIPTVRACNGCRSSPCR